MRNIFIIVSVWLLTSVCVAWAASYRTQANLRFSHHTHDKNSVSCATCHVDREMGNTDKMPDLPAGWQPLRRTPIVEPGAGSVSSQKPEINDTFGRPGEDRCLQCHFQTREKADCGLCHLEKPGYTERKRHRYEKPFSFSHKVHEQTECSYCHPGITAWETLDGHHIRGSMKNCLECHNGRQVPMTCVMCHNPTPRPKDHTRNYEKKHGMAYRSDPQHCAMCHEDSSCIDCHSRKPRDHTLAWVKRRHGIAALTNPQKCRACHLDQHVCLRCHENW